MRKRNIPYSYLMPVALFVLASILFVIPELPEPAILTYSEELTGTLSEGSQDNGPEPNSPFVASGLEDAYTRFRSWGIMRGKDGADPVPDPGSPEILQKYGGLYRGDTSKKTIYLTFDEGYENGYTSVILDTLANNGVNAVFFITGYYLDKEEALVRRMVEEGHAVGNHSVSHKSLPLLNDQEIENEITGLDRRFYDKFGQNMLYLRAPKGEYSERSLDITNRLGYVNVFWSFAYDDWAVNKQRGWEYAYNIVKRNLHNGAILLLHAVSSDNAQALDAIIKDVRAQGYEFGDVFELKQLARRDGP